MIALLLLSLVVGVSVAVPVEKITYANAVDVSAATSTTTFACYKSSNQIMTAFVRVYQPANGGSVDPNGPANVQNAISAGLGAEVFVTPQPVGSKTGAQQLDEAYTYLTNFGVNIRSIWIQVTTPINWPSNAQNNANFINSFLTRAQQRNIGIGIYTNAYDWQQITQNWNGWTVIQGGVNLWYWNVNAQGSAGQTPPNFNDFSSFSGFTSPMVKQFGQNINVCSTTVNIDVYKTGNMNADIATKATKEHPIVGLLMESVKY
jgi:hypothetical protein